MQYLKALLISALAIFIPIKPILLAAMTLCVVDLVLGVLAARKRKQKITSKGLGRTIVKIMVYEVAVCSGFVVQKYLINDAVPIVNLIGGLIGLTEMKSVLENLDAISGDKTFRTIVNRLASQSNKADSPHKE